MRALALALALAACSSAAEPASSTAFASAPLVTELSASRGLRVQVRTSPEQPPVHGVLAIELQIADEASGAPIDGLTLTATPWMPAHGHGTSVVPTATSSGDGRYTLSNVALYMPGAWQIRTDVHGAREDHVDVALEVR